MANVHLRVPGTSKAVPFLFIVISSVCDQVCLPKLVLSNLDLWWADDFFQENSASESTKSLFHLSPRIPMWPDDFCSFTGFKLITKFRPVLLQLFGVYVVTKPWWWKGGFPCDSQTNFTKDNFEARWNDDNFTVFGWKNSVLVSFPVVFWGFCEVQTFPSPSSALFKVMGVLESTLRGSSSPVSHVECHFYGVTSFHPITGKKTHPAREVKTWIYSKPKI